MCLSSPFEISILNILTREMKGIYEAFCSSDDVGDTFVSFFTCFNGMRQLLYKLARRVVSTMHFIANLNDVDDVIDAVCCAHHVLSQEDDIISHAYCPLDTRGTHGSPLSIYRYALPTHIMCSKYKDIVYCQDHYYNITSEIRFITVDGILNGFTGDTDDFRSPFVYLLQILFKLQE